MNQQTLLPISVNSTRRMFLKVFITPDAKKEKIEVKDGTLHISVKEPAERNQANKRVRQLVAARLGVSVGSVRIVSGHHSPKKTFSITTADPSDR